MPPFNFSKWRMTSPQITSGPIVEKDTLGLFFPSGAKDWLLYTFLTYRLPALIRLGEKLGLLRWYKSTDEEKETLTEVYGQTILYQLLEFIDRHIETCQDTLSVLVGIFTGVDYGVEFFALNESKNSWMHSAIDLEKTVGTCHSITYLTMVFLYDVICIAIKRCLIKRSRDSLFKRGNILCSESLKIIYGNLYSHEVSVKAYHQFNNITIAFYGLSDSATNALYRRFLEVD